MFGNKRKNLEKKNDTVPRPEPFTEPLDLSFGVVPLSREQLLNPDPPDGVDPEDYMDYGFMMIPDQKGQLHCYYCGAPVSKSDRVCAECDGKLKINWGVGAVLPNRRRRGKLRQGPVNFEIPVTTLHYYGEDYDRTGTYIDLADGMLSAKHRATPARCIDYPGSFFFDRVHPFRREQEAELKELLREADGCFVNDTEAYHNVEHELDLRFADGSEFHYSCDDSEASRRFLEFVEGLNRLAGFHLPLNGLVVVYQGEEELGRYVCRDKKWVKVGRTPDCEIQLGAGALDEAPIPCGFSYDKESGKFTLYNNDRSDIRTYTRVIKPGESEELWPDQDLWLADRRYHVQLKYQDPLL